MKEQPGRADRPARTLCVSPCPAAPAVLWCGRRLCDRLGWGHQSHRIKGARAGRGLRRGKEPGTTVGAPGRGCGGVGGGFRARFNPCWGCVRMWHRAGKQPRGSRPLVRTAGCLRRWLRAPKERFWPRLVWSPRGVLPPGAVPVVAPPSPRRIGRCVSLRTTRRAVWVPRGDVPKCFYGHLRCSLPSGAVLAAPSPTRNVTKGPWVDLGADFVCPGLCPVHLELGSAVPWGRDWFWAPCMGGSWGSGGAAGGPQPSLRGSLCPQARCRQGSAWQLPGGHQAGEGGGGAGQR